MKLKGPLLAIGAAALFGISTPVAKVFLSILPPALSAGLFYLGSGLGLSFWLLWLQVGKSRAKTDRQQSGSRSALRLEKDLILFFFALLSGGIVAPLLLFNGLNSTSAGSASLLLNSEALLTALIAWIVLKENYGMRLWVGMLLIACGAAILCLNKFTGLDPASSLGSLMVIAACLGWAIDNNLTSRISGLDPLPIAAGKGLCAGFVNCAIALIFYSGNWALLLHNWQTAALALVVGFFCYGVSLVLYILALRLTGAARTSAYFALAPFVGALSSLAFLQEPLTITFALAATLMAAGVWLHLSEDHCHEHKHEELEHSHEHTHDEHHQHEHEGAEPLNQPHTHMHRHAAILHTHPHYPDMHHGHGH